MILFFLLIVLVVLLLIAIWWRPKASKPGSQSTSVSSVLSSIVSDGLPVQATERDVVLDQEIQVIADLLRQDEADRRRAAALDRLASLQAIAKKTK